MCPPRAQGCLSRKSKKNSYIAFPQRNFLGPQLPHHLEHSRTNPGPKRGFYFRFRFRGSGGSVWGARGCRLRRRGRLGIGGELRARSTAGPGRGTPGTGGRQHGQTSEEGRGQRPFCLFPGQGPQAQGSRARGCVWGGGVLVPGGPDVGPWTLRSGVEQLQGAGGVERGWKGAGGLRASAGQRAGLGQEVLVWVGPVRRGGARDGWD